ncbi:hypothetical protein MVEN_00119900 [Mycena venus]|uniref:Uncharacterized protein n=1 Tax=Mycena venus TaxID=2733690 RepID=A0A8H6Z802_9AGAR|nr:hypothetical protein MVEN_00119900 [Mycena venus]
MHCISTESTCLSSFSCNRFVGCKPHTPSARRRRCFWILPRPESKIEQDFCHCTGLGDISQFLLDLLSGSSIQRFLKD